MNKGSSRLSILCPIMFISTFLKIKKENLKIYIKQGPKGRVHSDAQTDIWVCCDWHYLKEAPYSFLEIGW